MRKILTFSIVIFIFYSCITDELIDNTDKEKDTDIPKTEEPGNNNTGNNTDTPEKDPEEYDPYSEWDKPEYQKANTASNEVYLSEEEKNVYYYLNLVRINPALFAETFVADYDGDPGWKKGYAFDERKQSLMEELSTMEPLGLLYPEVEIYQYAQCFALEGGKLGLVGHDRSATNCDKSTKYAECCQYGGARMGLSIILSFLIDAGESNAALGHRRICLSNKYVKMGVSIEDHVNYRFNAVLNFARE